MLDWFRKKNPPKKQPDVPPGYTVVPENTSIQIVHPRPEAQIIHLDSGYWLADFGPEAGYEPQLLAKMAEILQAEPDISVIFVIQAAIVEAWTTDLSHLLPALRYLHHVNQQRSPAAQGHTLVVVDPLPRHAQGLMALLKSLGFGVHYYGPNETICVQVYQPDGTIVVGMNGQSFDYSVEPILHSLYERHKTLVDDEVALTDLKQEERAFVDNILYLYDPMTLADLVTRCADEGTPENLKAICDVIPYATLGAWLPQDHPQINSEDILAPERQIPKTTVPNFGPALITYCNIPGMIKLYPNDLVSSLKATDLLKVARQENYGVIISNGTDGRDSWVLLSPANIDAILRTPQ